MTKGTVRKSETRRKASISAEDLEQLRLYAGFYKNSRYSWKQALARDWVTGADRGAVTPMIKRTKKLGPKWLAGFHFPKGTQT